MNNNFKEQFLVNHIALFAVDGAFGLRENNILIGGFKLVTVIGSDDNFVKCEDVRAKMNPEDFCELQTTCTTYFIDRRLVVGSPDCSGEIRRAWYLLYDFASRNFNATSKEISNACINVVLDDEKRREFFGLLATIEEIEKLLGQTRKTYDTILARNQDEELLQDIGSAIDRFQEMLTYINYQQLDFFFDLFSIQKIKDANTTERF